MTRRATIEDLLGIKRRTAEVPIFTDPDLRAEFLQTLQLDVPELKEDLLRLASADEESEAEIRAKHESIVAEHTARVLELDAMVKETIVTVKLEAIADEFYDELIRQHPPTEEQKQGAAAEGRYLTYNPDTFPPALLVAVIKDPVMSKEQVQTFWATQSYDVRETLFQKAMEIQSERYGELLGKGLTPTLH